MLVMRFTNSLWYACTNKLQMNFIEASMIDKHYILKIDTQANNDWDKYILRNPLTGERPDVKTAIAKAVGNESGSYLIKVNINVEVLEKETNNCLSNTIELPIKTEVVSTAKNKTFLVS